MTKNNDTVYLRKFGSVVRKIRLSKELSQEALGSKAGLHRTYIGSIERGEQNISLINIKKLSKALGIRMSDIFTKL